MLPSFHFLHAETKYIDYRNRMQENYLLGRYFFIVVASGLGSVFMAKYTANAV